jgi:hypothetical protein
MFVSNLESEKSWNEIDALLRRYSGAPVHIILDNVGQNYVRRSFSKINYFDLLKVAERKFNYEISKTDLREKRFLGKNKKTGDWEYMFISSPIDDFLQNWLNLIGMRGNFIKGIYMLPLESENVLKILNAKLFSRKKAMEKNEKTKTMVGAWNIFMFENKVSGIREIAFNNGRMSFTRILGFEQEDGKSFANDFKTNKARTVEYLKRFSQDFDEKKIHIFAILSPPKKEELLKLGDDTVTVFSIKEFGNLFGEKDVEKYQSDYADALLQKLIIKNSKIISFSTNDMKSVKPFITALKYLSALKNISASIFFAFFVMTCALLVKTKLNLSNFNKIYEKEAASLEQRKKSEFGDNITNLTEITDAASFYNDLTTAGTDPFDFIKIFSQNSVGLVLVSDIKWKKNVGEHDFSAKYKSNFAIGAMLINPSGKVDDLFRAYENYEKKIKGVFPGYMVKISQIPKNINFSASYNFFPMKMDFWEK